MRTGQARRVVTLTKRGQARGAGVSEYPMVRDTRGETVAGAAAAAEPPQPAVIVQADAAGEPPRNLLIYGDNLDVLQLHVRDESVDLIYLDPPFNSNATYNQLFSEEDGTRAAAQIKAFGDTLRWDQAAVRAYQSTVEAGGKLSEALQVFMTLLGGSSMLAYLSMMAPRLVQLHRVAEADRLRSTSTATPRRATT